MAYCADSILKCASMETEWGKHIGDVFDLDLIPSIFRVPDSVKAADPQSFSPQLVGLGPFHHFQAPLWELTAMKRRFIQQGLRRFSGRDDFRAFAGELVAPLLPLIRAQYDDAARILEINDSTLASLVAIDCLFLIELLLSSSSSSSATGSEKSTRLGSLLMNDALMLENQIPLLWLLDRASSCQLDLARVCDLISPLKLQPAAAEEERRPPAHLLEYLYFRIVGDEAAASITSSSQFDSSAVSRVLETVPAGLLIRQTTNGVDDIEVTDVLKFAAKKAGSWVGGAISWCLDLGIFKFLNRYVQEEEALIPSASQLARGLGVKFLCRPSNPSEGRIAISFNNKQETTTVLCLPAFTIKPNCEVLMKNLLAYESLARSQHPQVLTRYLELMRCLITTRKDAKLLREAGVLVMDGDDDKNAAELFGRISGASAAAAAWGGKTAVDSEIEAVNLCYYSKGRIMIWKRRLRMGLKLGVMILILLTALGALVYFVAKQLPKLFQLDIGDCLSLWYGSGPSIL